MSTPPHGFRRRGGLAFGASHLGGAQRNGGAVMGTASALGTVCDALGHWECEGCSPAVEPCSGREECCPGHPTQGGLRVEMRQTPSGALRRSGINKVRGNGTIHTFSTFVLPSWWKKEFDVPLKTLLHRNRHVASSEKEKNSEMPPEVSVDPVAPQARVGRSLLATANPEFMRLGPNARGPEVCIGHRSLETWGARWGRPAVRSEEALGASPGVEGSDFEEVPMLGQPMVES